MFGIAGTVLVCSLAQSGALVEVPVHPTRLLVETAPGADETDRVQAFVRAGVTELRHLPQISWTIVEVPATEREHAREILASDPAVARVRHDRARRAAYVPNDPMWSNMWHMMTIRADDAWDTTRGSPAIRIAIVDSGVETTHADLAANVWSNPGEIVNGLDDDGNGYVDDVSGYDFVAGDPIPEDVIGHGTSVAGIAAAEQDNALGVTGVAPLCRLVALKAGTDAGLFFDSTVVPALVYCADMGFEVVAMSFAGDGVTPAEKDAIEYCWEKGLVLVASAGNDASVYPLYPAAYDEVLGVGATQDASDKRAFFTNHGTWVDIAAPGRSLRTTALGSSYTTTFQGTSGSVPHVAGAAALLLSANPTAKNAEVRAALEDTSMLLSETGYGYWTNHGRIDVQAAVDRILGITTGSVDPRLLFVAPSGGPTRPAAGPGRRARIPVVTLHGVGLEEPNVLEFTAGTRVLPITSQDRKRAAFVPLGVRNRQRIELARDGVPFGSFVWERASGLLFSATDAGSSSGGDVLGAFPELYRNDGVELTCTRNSFSEVYVEYVVRGISTGDFSQMLVQYSRAYTDVGGGTETIEVYDWSSGSFPNGSWVTLDTRTILGSPTMEDLVLAVPGDPTRIVDETGTVYLRVTATGAAPTGSVSVDRLRLLVR